VPPAPAVAAARAPLSAGRAARAQALLVMDLHAHLSRAEVIGLLGGTWDPARRHVAVLAAFPCRRAPGSLSGTSVELDPAAEVEARALIAGRGFVPVGWRAPGLLAAPGPRLPPAPPAPGSAHMRCTLCSPSAVRAGVARGQGAVLPARAGRGLHNETPGLPRRARRAGGPARARRYHSHPVFAPKPSLKDAENQRNYQALFRCTASGLEPFVGGIVGPFDVLLPTQAGGLPRWDC